MNTRDLSGFSTDESKEKRKRRRQRRKHHQPNKEEEEENDGNERNDDDGDDGLSKVRTRDITQNVFYKRAQELGMLERVIAELIGKIKSIDRTLSTMSPDTDPYFYDTQRILADYKRELRRFKEEYEYRLAAFNADLAPKTTLTPLKRGGEYEDDNDGLESSSAEEKEEASIYFPHYDPAEEEEYDEYD